MGDAAVVMVRPDRPELVLSTPGPIGNRHAPARSEHARLESNQRPLPSHGSAPPLSYGRTCLCQLLLSLVVTLLETKKGDPAWVALVGGTQVSTARLGRGHPPDEGQTLVASRELIV